MVEGGRREPVHWLVADDLRDQIAAGQLPQGAKLPGEQDLARRYGLGLDAIRDALAELRGEGLIVTRQGYGSTVREVPPRTRITPPPGSVVTARMPSRRERQELDIPEGVPAFEVNGRLYPCHLYELAFPDPM